MKKGFSLTEIISTIVILGILAAIAVPGFSKAQKKNDARQAVTYLQTIRLAEKMRYSKHGSYLCVPATDCPEAASMVDADAINTVLGTEIKEGKYGFSVVATATTFTATATAADCTIDLDNTGTYTATNVNPGTCQFTTAQLNA